MARRGENSALSVLSVKSVVKGITGLQLALLINFKYKKLQWKRVVR